MLDLGTLNARITLDSSQYVSSLNRAQSITSSSMAEIRGALLQTFGVAGISGLFFKASKSAMDFGAELSNISSIANDLDISKIKDGLLELDSVYGSSIDLARAFYQTYSAGIRGSEQDLVDFTGKVASLSKTILSDQATTVQAVTKLMNAYGMSVENAGEVMDTFFQIVKLGQTTGSELAGSIGQVVNSASVAKLSLDELGAAIAVLSRTMPTSVAVTSLNQAILAFIQPTKEAIEVAKKYGIELSASALQQKGFANAIAEINSKAGDNVEALATMFGNIRSFRAVASLASNQAEEFQDVLSQFKNKGGSQLEAFGTATANLKTTWSEAMVSMEKAFIHLGDALAPSIQSIANFIEGLSSMIKGFSDNEIQIGLLSSAIVFLTSKIASYTVKKAIATQQILQNTVATQANTAAQIANAQSLTGFSSLFLNSSKNVSVLTNQMNALNAANRANNIAMVVGGLNQLMIAGVVAVSVYKLTESFMENTEAGNKLRDTLGNIILEMEKFIGMYDELEKRDKKLTEDVKKIEMKKMEEWRKELENTEYQEQANQIFEQYSIAIKEGKEKVARELRNKMTNLLKQVREVLKETSENIPQYKVEVQELVKVNNIKGELSERLLSMTENEFKEFKKIAEERFGETDLFRLSIQDYENIFNIKDFQEAFKNSEKEFKNTLEEFQKEINYIRTKAILEGDDTGLMKLKEYDILKSQMERIKNELEKLEKDRQETIKRGMTEETKFLESEISKRLDLYDKLKTASEQIEEGKELSSEEIISKQVQEAGGLKEIRRKILAQEEGTAPGFEKKTIEQYLSTLDLKQREKFQSFVDKIKGRGADEKTAQTTAVLMMQRELEKQAKIDDANNRQMIDLLQQLNDYFKGGGAVILPAP